MTDENNDIEDSAFVSRVEKEVKTSVLEIYEDLLGTVWAKILPTLGAVTVVTIVTRAIGRAAKNHPVLNYLTVRDSGIDFDQLKEKIGTEKREELKGSFRELIANLFDILAKLTGNILVQQLIREVDGLDVESDGAA